MSEQPHWERATLEKVALAAVKEQRSSRRWNVFFRLCWLVLLVAGGVALFGDEDTASDTLGTGRHTVLITLNGEISSENKTGEHMVKALDKAFKDKNAAGVVIRANSPGGSPVQSAIVYDEIRRLKAKNPNLPVYVVVEEVCASGCYYIAAAADKIFVSRASIVGSIGLLSDGFGFSGVLDKLGVERRLMTAGDHKAMNDPFSPRNPRDEAIRQQLLNEVHAQFIQAVKAGRGMRLKEDPLIFSGMYWLGDKSLMLGVTDAYGTVESVARDILQAETLVDVTPTENLSDRFAKKLGMGMSVGLTSALLPSGLK